MFMLEKGLVQVYTGDGKGKTTAAVGLALRAVGQGNKVLIYQFLKPPVLETGEGFALKISNLRIRLEALDVPWNVFTSLKDPRAVSQARAAISEVLGRLAETAAKRFYDVLILDELVWCLANGLAELRDVEALIKKRDPRVEVVLTGRGATKQLIEMADLVTEMKEIKHPFNNGVKARAGIDF